jgi:hypothetical protein
MTIISPEVRQAVEQSGHAELVDPDTNATYVVIRAEQYERVKGILDPTEAIYPLLDEVFREGWHTPQMAEYDDYESRRP